MDVTPETLAEGEPLVQRQSTKIVQETSKPFKEKEFTEVDLINEKYNNNLPLYENETVSTMSVESTKWTSAYTILKVLNKPIRVLADTGASCSVISYEWLKYMKLQDSLIKTEVNIVDAQKVKIPVMGIATIPVEFGRKTYQWPFRVAEKLICPMILGMNVLNTGCIHLKERYVEVDNERMPITITLNEFEQETILSAINVVIPPWTLQPKEVKGELMKGSNELDDTTVNTYIINSGGSVQTNTLVTSIKKKNDGAKQVHEYVPVHVVNLTNKKKIIRKGDILATAEKLTEEQINAFCEFTPEKEQVNNTIIACAYSYVSGKTTCPNTLEKTGLSKNLQTYSEGGVSFKDEGNFG